ncbi:cation diffusion facilitator family transporter [Kroppenstedtia eburnea]|uniref:Cation diffusion facilitator family transporter n=1 Tax=Kroppenstedtia eburnea TaxID=714067 RepID=A0A1N7M7L6_9BACL|nr:cation diffusion facilitator family transporter [Kroppenstedtia eburnea]QKI81869.1 cation transporter [Kroppenstedtia eburnea]SIS81979.1 cation diffusion facilitator family transporter [Kroppenstedtia eburnea]
MNNQQIRQAETGAWVGIIGNLVLAVQKGGIGWFSHSRALMADAVHSASDVIGSVAVLIGVRAANLPPDEEHPYGHGKAESIAAIIVSILLGLAGIQIGYSSFKALLGPVIAPGWPAAVAALVSILAKEGMFRYKYMLGKRIGSQAIIANAWEHRSDVYSSVAALFGIGGALLGERWGVPFLVYLDPVAGIFVSILVLRMAWRLSKESVRSTLDQVLPEEESRELIQAAAQVEGVRHVDVLRAREHGFYVIVDIKVAVDPQLTVEEGHHVGKEVKRQLLDRFDHVADVMVHINPYHI